MSAPLPSPVAGRPGHRDRREWARALLLAAGTGLLMAVVVVYAYYDHGGLAVTMPNGEVRTTHPPRFGTDLDLPPC
jgi:ferric-dicitrate binding protein FerR (iron transport regulator)